MAHYLSKKVKCCILSGRFCCILIGHFCCILVYRLHDYILVVFNFQIDEDIVGKFDGMDAHLRVEPIGRLHVLSLSYTSLTSNERKLFSIELIPIISNVADEIVSGFSMLSSFTGTVKKYRPSYTFERQGEVTKKKNKEDVD